ncbi:MAG: type II secretion system secretin GspD [Thermodesulfobacteriota bacterium]|nr:type II secretion system secretin GspD [Thermodesulfobacteriota bacterium]
MIRFIFCLLCPGLWLLAGNTCVQGARIAGEEGVTPVAGQVVERPTRIKPPPGAGDQNRSAHTEETAVRDASEFRDESEAGEQAPKDSRVTIDFDNVDIAIFIKFISELTGRNFVIDEGVRGKVTIISPTRITVTEAYRVFESVLEVHGYTTVPAGSITKIVPALKARSKSVETRLREESVSPEDKVITQIVPLQYANPDELKKLFTPLISKSSVIVSYPPTGMLIVTDVSSNIRRFLRIIEEIDVEGIGEEISLVSLEHAAASTLSKSLNTLFKSRIPTPRKGAYTGPLIKIVPDERTNSLIVFASENDTLKVERLIGLLDRKIPRGGGNIHVYYLQNANAEDMADVLATLPSKKTEQAEKGKAPVISRDVHIVPDKATNSLVITAEKDDYLVLEDVIKKLDIPRRMVYIEALLMEVSVTKTFDLGVEWQAADDIGSYDDREIGAFGGSTLSKSIFPSVDPTTGTVGLPTGFSVGVLGEGITIGDVTFPSIGAVIRAYQTDSDVHILSTPQIMTTDNEEAEIQVGKNIPYLTRQDTSETGIDYSNYEFKDVGVTLTITPQINQERLVRLKISQEVSQVVDQEVIGLPTTLRRVANTTVIIKDSNTVVIGGLIDETLDAGTYRVPCLGGVPLLGWFFRSVSSSRDKTNLFIFLTPHIVENPTEAEDVYKEKKEQIDMIKEDAIKMYEKQGTN